MEQDGPTRPRGQDGWQLNRIHDVGKTKAPARGFPRAQFFDDQVVRQGG